VSESKRMRLADGSAGSTLESETTMVFKEVDYAYLSKRLDTS